MIKAPPLRNDCFALPPGVNWMPVDDALARLKNQLHPVAEVETLPIAQADGRILARDVAAQRSHPPHANAAVDGYGFAGGLGDGEHILPLAPGGRAKQSLRSGGALIMAAAPHGLG